MSAIILPFSRPLRKITYGAAQDLPQPNYRDYDLFKLKTKLVPRLAPYLGIDVQMVFMQTAIDNNAVETIRFEKIPSLSSMGDTTVIPMLIPVKLSESQHAQISGWVKEALTTYADYALIGFGGWNYSLVSKYVPDSWITAIMPYVFIDPEYNPFITSDGIYVRLDPADAYLEIYDQIVEDIQVQLRDFYNQGFVVGAHAISETWGLTRCDPFNNVGDLYKPSWVDTRIAPDPVDFILSRIAGQNRIPMVIDTNNVYRHLLADTLNSNGYDYYFSRDEIHFSASTLAECQKIASLIERTNSADMYGQVVLLELPDAHWFPVYESAIEEIYQDFNAVRYQTDNPLTPFTLSALFNLNISPSREQLRIELAVDSTLVQPTPTPALLEALSLPSSTTIELANFPSHLFVPVAVPPPKSESKEPESPLEG